MARTRRATRQNANALLRLGSWGLAPVRPPARRAGRLVAARAVAGLALGRGLVAAAALLLVQLEQVGLLVSVAALTAAASVLEAL